MPTRLSEIIAVPLTEKIRREQWAVHTAKRDAQSGSETPVRFDITGDSDPGELKAQIPYRLWGVWDNSKPQFGPAFRFNSFEPLVPHNKTGIVAYLKEYCRGIGDVTALVLWEEFGGEAVRVLRESPEKAAAAVGPRFPLEKAKLAAEDLEVMKAAEGISIELYDLFAGRGFGKACVRQALKLWGAEAISTLRADPFMTLALRGVGFRKADAFYLDLGHDPKAMHRQSLCITYAATKEAGSSGHVWSPVESASSKLHEMIGGTEVIPEAALELAVSTGRLMVRKDESGRDWVSETDKAAAEDYACQAIVQAFYESQAGSVVSDWETQREYIRRPLDRTRCTRCRRTLTAATVAVLDGKPFGPDCIQKVQGIDASGQAERMPLADWLAGQHTLEVREVQTATNIERVLSPVQWPGLNHAAFADLSDHQGKEYSLATAGPIGILGGRPGTGKTYTMARIVKAIIAMHGEDSLAVCCPTGKAAVRCKETLAAAGCDSVNPKTIHRTLGVLSAEDGWTFAHNETNPLPVQFILVDEASMIGLGLFKSLLAARARGCGLLLIGDVNQLPPVEFGAPLRDLIAAGLPYGELREIHRNSGLIVKTCSAIVDGVPWQPADKIDLQSDDPVNLALIPAGKNQAVAKVLNLVGQLKDHSPWDAVWDVQVLVAVNKRSPLARTELNKQLQAMLNPNPPVKNSPFRLGDKVIQLKNSFLQVAVKKTPKFTRINRRTFDVDEREIGPAEWAADSSEEGKVLVCNGEIGRVIHAEEKKTVCRFENPERTVIVFRGAKDAGANEDDGENSRNGNGEKDNDKPNTGCDLDLAYAVTTHKAQGSQWPIIIYCLDEYPGATGQYGVCDKAHFYTGISRASKACFLVGLKHVADSICSRSFIYRRKTFTRELIEQYAAQCGIVFSAERRIETETPELACSW